MIVNNKSSYNELNNSTFLQRKKEPYKGVMKRAPCRRPRKRQCSTSTTTACLFLFVDVNLPFSTCLFLLVDDDRSKNCPYKHALRLYKLFNSNNMSEDWVSLNYQQIFNERNEHFQVVTKANYKVGKNLMVNRFRTLNNKINFSWLNGSYESYKIKCKQCFL